jgi:hypothetical protein
MAQCLTGKGWSARAMPDGGLEAGGAPIDQQEQFEADFDACGEKLGYHLPRAPITVERAAEIWDDFLSAADCVAGLGYHVDEPPSRTFAIEQLQQSTIRLGWHPHEHVPPLEQDKAYRECPAPVL